MASTERQVAVRPVASEADRQAFIDLPWRIYAGDPNWVPPLRSEVAQQFAPDNPFFSYGTLQRFLARGTDGTPRGRIAAIINRRLIEREGRNVGLFGFFECERDAGTAQALLEAACQWLRQQGMGLARGPIDLATHNNCFFQISGFDSPPRLMMPYNPPYYPELVEQLGWHKAKDAYAYDFSLAQSLPSKFERAYRVAVRSGLTLRPIRTQGQAFEQDAHSLYALYSRAFSANWSATPQTEQEFLAQARSLQSLVDPDIFYVAEDGERMVGLTIALPDYNIALRHVNGKLNWWGKLKFLWYRRQIDRARVLAIGALPEYRRQMVPLALGYCCFQGCKQPGKRYRQVEGSWVFEDNYASRRPIEAAGARIYKTYRMYEKAL